MAIKGKEGSVYTIKFQGLVDTIGINMEGVSSKQVGVGTFVPKMLQEQFSGRDVVVSPAEREIAMQTARELNMMADVFAGKSAGPAGFSVTNATELLLENPATGEVFGVTSKRVELLKFDRTHEVNFLREAARNLEQTAIGQVTEPIKTAQYFESKGVPEMKEESIRVKSFGIGTGNASTSSIKDMTELVVGSAASAALEKIAKEVRACMSGEQKNEENAEVAMVSAPGM